MMDSTARITEHPAHSVRPAVAIKSKPVRALRPVTGFARNVSKLREVARQCNFNLFFSSNIQRLLVLLFIFIKFAVDNEIFSLGSLGMFLFWVCLGSWLFSCLCLIVLSGVMILLISIPCPAKPV